MTAAEMAAGEHGAYLVHEHHAARAAAAGRQDAPAASAPAAAAQQIARRLLDAQGEGSQFACLDPLWRRESGWDVSAANPSSAAYGIPQALPGSKMASAGPDWQTSAETQIKWGLRYIQAIYGSPCAAWSHEENDGWY